MTALYDRRRVNGPDETFLPLFNVNTSDEITTDQPVWALDEQRLLVDPTWKASIGLERASMTVGDDKLEIPRIARRNFADRGEGRDEREARPMYVQTGLVPNASGSALLECGRTKLACAVHGPRQMRGRQYAGQAELNVAFNMAPFSDVHRFKPGKDVESPGSAALVKQALLPAIRLDLLPKASIDVYITVLDMDTSVSGCIALATTAASAALAEAGIEMYGLSAIPSLPFQGKVHQKWLVDPSLEEATHASVDLLLCTMPAIGRTTCYSLQGPADDFKEVQKVTDTLSEVNTQLHSTTAQALYKVK
ncbi:MTR3 [Malassezia furfur]|nr:MTR3 [Malassezia furfur]